MPKSFLSVLMALGIAASVSVGSSATAWAAQAAEVTEIRALGTSNSFCGFFIDDARELQKFLVQYRADIDRVLEDASLAPGTDTEALLLAVSERRVRSVEVPVGTELAWMAVRRDTRPTRIERVRWSGTEPFQAFEIALDEGCVEHRFLIPKSCGNVSLLSSRAGAAPVMPGMDVRQAGRCVGDRVAVTLAPAPSVSTELELSLVRPGGAREVVALEGAGGRGLDWSATLDEPGTYRLEALARNACGVSPPAVREVTLEPCVPICRIRLVPAGPASDSTVLIDTSGSGSAGGEIVATQIDVDRAGERIDRLQLTGGAERTSFRIPARGLYRFEAVVRDERGASSSNECVAVFDAAPIDSGRRAIGVLSTVFGGLERRWRHVPSEALAAGAVEDQSSALAGATGGILFSPSDALGVFGTFGAAINLEDSEYSTLFADAGVDLFAGSGFVGGGAGIWDLNHEETRDTSVFVHGGLDTPWRLGPLAVQWYAEGRLFLDMLDMVGNNYVVLTGLRFVSRPPR